jgi:predicted unusual protein kinase regulating ubiquinone biosynthesis (AarF/ABC1/UbiB family)
MFKKRYRRILWFFFRVLVSLAWWDILLPNIGLRQLSNRTRRNRTQRIASRFRILAINMGGVMIKVGQFLSSRLDVLPREITDELSGLQDEVRAESFEAMRKVIEAEFSAPLADKYCYFEEQPMASASIGQVHRARICVAAGEVEPPPVVVKVQRPNIEAIVRTDLQALQVVGGWVQRYPPVGKRANVPALLNEFSRTLYEEIDYLAEGKNAETFAENFKERPDVRVPQVIWSHTTRRVLTLQDVQSIKITDYAAVEAAGINRAEVANRLLDTYLKQIFEDHFFHADPHPGNLFVYAQKGEGDESLSQKWQLVFVDFGMVGRIQPNVVAGLRELLIAIGTRDPARIVRSYQILGVLLPSADTKLLEKAGARVFERFWGKTTPEIMKMDHAEAVAFAMEFSDLLYDLPFQIPENLIMLGRSLGILSGMCTGLYPEFNIWSRIAPYATKLVEAEGSSTIKTLLSEVGGSLQSLLSLPRKTDDLINRLQLGQLEVRQPELQQQVKHLQQAVWRLAAAVVFAALLLSAVQVYLAGSLPLAGGLAIATLLAFLWLIIPHR